MDLSLALRNQQLLLWRISSLSSPPTQLKPTSALLLSCYFLTLNIGRSLLSFSWLFPGVYKPSQVVGPCSHVTSPAPACLVAYLGLQIAWTGAREFAAGCLPFPRDPQTSVCCTACQGNHWRTRRVLIALLIRHGTANMLWHWKITKRFVGPGITSLTGWLVANKLLYSQHRHNRVKKAKEDKKTAQRFVHQGLV